MKTAIRFILVNRVLIGKALVRAGEFLQQDWSNLKRNGAAGDFAQRVGQTSRSGLEALRKRFSRVRPSSS
jgi:hypothetical protein